MCVDEKVYLIDYGGGSTADQPYKKQSLYYFMYAGRGPLNTAIQNTNSLSNYYIISRWGDTTRERGVKTLFARLGVREDLYFSPCHRRQFFFCLDQGVWVQVKKFIWSTRGGRGGGSTADQSYRKQSLYYSMHAGCGPLKYNASFTCLAANST